MLKRKPHRKKVKHCHDPGDFHELTFSCFRRMPLLTNNRWRAHLARRIDDAIAAQDFRLVAFVFMPEHVHLLVFPTRRDTTAQSISDLQQSGSRLLARLTIRERPGRMTFRFWQEGPGYDRNLQTPAAVMAAIDYIHLNPVRRGLCKSIGDWRWSSARWYLSDRGIRIPCCRQFRACLRDSL